MWPVPKWWVVQPGVSRGWDLRGPPPFFCGGRCVFEFAPRTGTSVAPAIAAETVRLVETTKNRRNLIIRKKYNFSLRLLLKAGCRWYGICTFWVENLLFEVIS